MEPKLLTKDEIKDTIREELVSERGRFVSQFWYVLIGLFFTTAAAWFSLYYQVQQLADVVDRNYSDLNKQTETLKNDYKQDVAEIKSDVRFIRDALIKNGSTVR